MAVASGGLAAVASLATGGVAGAAQTFTVTDLNDAGAGSLRAAIAQVNADTTDTAAPGDSIVFASGLSGTIALTTADTSSSSLYMRRPVQIAGPGANQLTISAAPAHRVLDMSPASGVTAMAVKLSGLTLTGGSPGGTSQGGGIRASLTSLELDGVAVTGNHAGYSAGVDVFGPATTLTMNNSTISGNVSGSTGTGAVYSKYGTVINDSTITGNSGAYGAGLDAQNGPVTITGSTVAGNTPLATNAGQIYQAHGTLALQDSIVSGSGSAPDIVLSTSGGATGTASFSLVRNAAAPSAHTPITTDGTDITSKDPQLGALAFNGGPTETMVPLPTSPVLDQGKAFGLATDQRGLSRPFALPTITSVPAGGDRSDIGAVETRTPVLAAIAPSSGGAGTPVAIVGTGFTGATQVLFGSIPATSFTVLNDGALTAVAPVNVQTQDVRVITPLGESPVVGADRFTFPTFTPTVAKHKPKLSGNTLNTGLTVTCPSGGLSCTGTFKATAFIKHHKTKLAGGSITLTAGQNKTITFKLSKKALKALKSAGKLKITIQFVITDGTEPPTTINETITLKHKHKKH